MTTDNLDNQRPQSLGALLPGYLEYARLEWQYAALTLSKYREAMGWIIRVLGDVPPSEIRKEEVLKLKAATSARGVGPVRVKSMVVALKSFLKFCQVEGIAIGLDPREIRAPRIPRREVIFLTPEEVEQFVSAIPIHSAAGSLRLKWLAFRALVEVFLGTGMRLSEALSLTRSSINFRTGEARIVGKGNKERVVFFTPRALGWVKEYSMRRRDDTEALFVLPSGRPFQASAVQAWFKEIRQHAALSKPVTAHILRHTVATTLLFRGCAIGHIKEVLGHEHLQTTCTYYLGTDRRATRDAHRTYLDYTGMVEDELPDLEHPNSQRVISPHQ